MKWAAPPLGNRFVGKIVQARRVDDATPDFYVQEQSNSTGVGEVIRAFTADGQQKWRWPTDGRLIAMTAADNNGGVLAFNAFPSDTQNYLSSVSKDGVQSWRTATPNAILLKYAVHPDGTIFYLKVPTGGNVPPAEVIALDPATGQPRFSVSLPGSTSTTTGIRGGYVNPTTGQTYTICDPLNSGTSGVVGRFGGLVIDGDGKLWVPVVANATYKSVACTPEVDQHGDSVPWDGSGTSYSYTSTVYLVSVTSAGASSTTQLDSSSGSGTSWNDPMPRFNLRNAIIPNGAGGVLVSVVKPDLSNPVYRSSGVQLSTPLSSVDQMLLGENDTVFAAGNFGGVAALNLQTGSVLWQRPEATSLVAALGDGSVIVEGSPMRRIDANGVSSPFTADTQTYASSYYGGDLWATSMLSGGPGMVSSGLDDQLIWWFAQYWARRSGNEQKQNAPPTRVELRVHRLTQSPILVEHILQLVDTAVHYWSWQGVELTWDGVVRPLDQCLINPGNCLDTDDENILNLSSDTVFRWQQSRQVFEKFVDRKGVDAIFINTVLGSARDLITLHFPTTSCCFYSVRKSNVVLAGSDADNALDHEIGHVFQLDHTLDPRNLMCDPSITVCLGRSLNNDQQDTVRVEAPKLAK